MPSPLSFPLNARVLSTDANHIAIKGINAHEKPEDQPIVADAVKEHTDALAAFRDAGIKVEQIASPEGCQDGVFTANWGLTWGGKALLSKLPNLRAAEEPHAERALQDLDFETRRASVLFSGQGDALIIGGERVMMGNGYRTNPTVAREIKEYLGLEPIIVRAKPKRHWYGLPVKNKATGLWDSYYYDLDLAVSVLRPDLLAVCFDALTSEGRAAVASVKDVEIIPVDLHEARDNLACNLVSTGDTVIMVDNAPLLADAISQKGLEVVLLPNHELKKGGGGFRCSALSLYR